jgi:hypothetical protein
MKTIIIAVAFHIATISAFAQHDHSNHGKQNTASISDTSARSTLDSVSQRQFSILLLTYYNIKNALITSDGESAASNARDFLKTANTLDFKIFSEGNIHILAKDAGRISDTKDIKKQRDYFASLSSNMAILTKSLKIGAEPIYLQYCPMKKASWLSAEKEIRNPYYGTAMLTCGEVTETL